jgi:SAM-dependent methyltransferase
VPRSRVKPSPVRRALRLERRRDIVLAGLAVGMVANALRWRERLSALPVLPDSDRPADPDHVFLLAEGVHLDDATRRAASDYARAHHLDVLDLVPADLPTEQAVDLARLVDPVTYRSSRIAPGRGAYQATLVERSFLERAEISADQPLDPVSYYRASATLKKFAPTSSDLAVAPHLRAVEEDLDKRLAFLRAAAGDALPLVTGAPFASAAFLAGAAVVNPLWGGAALAAHAAQPLLATKGTPVTPRDQSAAGLSTRVVRQLRRAVVTVRGRWEPPAEVAAPKPDDAELRRVYAELLADGVDRFFEPRRVDCPRCGSADLREFVRIADLIQFKPGEFVLEECGGCQHIFQNPRLSIEGLDFYYRDFYDGLGEQALDTLFSLDDDSYRGRVEMVRRATRPKRWLDVGAGHGHFCLIAGGALPDTRFDGLDMSDSIDEAARCGWIETAHRGLFPELASELTGGYDVVSMHHYLEHTREPWEEIDAARTVLEPGGHLLVEVPDPDTRIGRRLGWLWGPWLQPQHLHFLSVRNISAELEQRGFTVVDVEKGPAHQPYDLAFAAWLVINKLAPHPEKPWLPVPTTAQRAGRLAAFVGLGPLVALGLLLDHLLLPVMRRVPDANNCYRILARRD